MIEAERVRMLNERAERDGRYVLYWMQQSQRGSFNPALNLAVREANVRGCPVIVAFGLTDGYPEANARHYGFMLQGLACVSKTLAARGIPFVIRRGAPDAVASRLAGEASLVVCDRGYLRHQKQWRQTVAETAACPVVQVEGDVVVPVDLVSHRAEHAARTIRPKILRHRDRFLTAFEEVDPAIAEPEARAVSGIDLASDVDLADWRAVLETLAVDRRVAPVGRFAGGTECARALLDEFLHDRFAGYAANRNEPYRWQCSFMSPYLHFGQISPVEIALAVRDHEDGTGRRDDRAAYLEELIVRRELAANFVNFTRDYDTFTGAVPEWAQRTLEWHREDPRQHIYSREQLEAAATHDPYWNAAMREMAHTGFMHNYMRMYWAKKILEWTARPEDAFRTALAINNTYFLDGRDCNSYANVAWCFGLHDRGWTERPVFGTVRYMAASGLKRKFDIERYVEAVDELAGRETNEQEP